jgi:hypothetical protein
MRTLLSIVALGAALAGSAAAADHSGAWRSIEAKSSWSNGQLPKGFSLTINLQFTGDTLTYRSVNDTNKDKPGGLTYVAKLDGTPSPIANNARFNQVVVKRRGPDQFEVLEMRDDDVIVGSFWTFSSDGKTFIRRGVGKDAAGKSKAFEELFERK